MRLNDNMRYDKSWEKFICESKYLSDMQDFVDKTKDICPSKEKVFRFFGCDIDRVKCVILGMDPYPSTYIRDGIRVPVATGRAFEVDNVETFIDKYKQQSLTNIFKTLCYYKFGKKYNIDELRSNDISHKIEYINIHKWFDEMEREGVMFLNATLTTTMGKSGAHIDVWKDFMDELIRFIDDKTKCKWLIWGNVALNRVKDIVDAKHIIYSCHPASRKDNNFVDDCCFRKIKNIRWF